MRKFKSVKNQTIVITGASSGIGLATARRAARKGAQLVISSRNEGALREIADELKQTGARVLAVKADVTSPAEMEHLRDEALHAFGRIDTWINNAGTSIYGPLLNLPLEDEKQLFEINFWGIRHGCHAAVSALKEKGGVIINLGSEVSSRAVPAQGIYSATKHAVKAYTDALRMEVERQGWPISVCLVRPTAINTPFAEHAENFLESGEPSLPAPTYDPDVAAKAILKCAESPQRDVFVGAGSRIEEVLDAFFPRLLDYFMEDKLVEQQSQGTGRPHTKEQEALWHPPEREGEVLGGNRGKMRRHSAYNAAAQHPWRTLALAGGAALLGSLLYTMAADEERSQEERAA